MDNIKTTTGKLHVIQDGYNSCSRDVLFSLYTIDRLSKECISSLQTVKFPRDILWMFWGRL